jgi:hypothetical protein
MSNPETADAVFSVGHHTAERTHEEPSHALFAAWQNCAINQRAPAEDRAFQRHQLSTVAENACASQGNTQARDQIMQGSAVFEYLWFGSDHTPLPPGLRRFQVYQGDAPTLALNPYVFGSTQFGAVLQLLRNTGLDVLLAHRQQLRQEQSAAVFEPLARAVVANTPGYRLLESFNTMQHRWQERPLTPTERLIEEQSAEKLIRARYGLNETDPLPLHHAVRTDLNRALRRIDEATRYDRIQLPEIPPRKRALTFFFDVIANELNLEEGQPLKIDTIRRPTAAGKEHPQLYVATSKTAFYAEGESVVTFAESQGLLSTPNMSRTQRISALLVGDMALCLFDSAQEGRNYTELLDELLDRHTAELIRDMNALDNGTLAPTRLSALLTLLTAPSEVDERLDGPWMLVPQPAGLAGTNRVVSRSEYRRELRETLGHIRKRPFEDNDVRVLQYSRRDETLAPLDETEASVILHLPHLDQSLMPRIMGYEPVGYDTERRLYGLRYTPEADPYAECRTLIPAESRRSLAATYADMGLRELAAFVHSTENLTVGQLARLIARTNHYILPGQSEPADIPETLAEFAKQVKNGRLGLQCVGSSHFLRASLQQVFGRFAAGVIGGDSLPPGGRRLSMVGHQQTTFIDPETGRLYILDATSSGFHPALLREAITQQLGELRRLLSWSALKSLQPERMAPPAPHTPPDPNTPQAPTDTQVLEYRNRLIEQTKDALILQLRMVYGQNGQPLAQDRMFEAVANLPGDDILFRSLSTAILASQGRLAREEAQHLAQYIQAMRHCNDQALLRKLDPNGYTTQPRLIDALQTHLNQLARLTD